MQRPLKIAHVIHTYGMAGAEKHLQYLLPELKKYGIECELICVTRKRELKTVQEFLNKLELAGIKTSVFTYKRKIKFWNISRRIAAFLKQNNFSTLHSHLFNADFISSFIKTFFYKELITISTKHGYNEDQIAKMGFDKKISRSNVYYFISRWLIKKTNYNIGVSKAISNLYFDSGLTRQRMHFIHHGIEIPEKILPEQTVVGKPKIMTVGRLVPFKGHIYLIKAMPILIKKFPQLKLIIIGDGPEKEKLMQEAEVSGIIRNIEFVVSNSPFSFVNQCDVMVIPSLFEAFGIVYIEAFAMKIPLIAFDGGASEEIIDHMKNGILVPKKDIDCLAEKIMFLLGNPEEGKKLADAAFAKFQDQFTVERMARETAEFYFRIIADSARLTAGTGGMN